MRAEARWFRTSGFVSAEAREVRPEAWPGVEGGAGGRGGAAAPKRRAADKVEPGCATGGGEVSASGPMFWIARAGGQKVTIRTPQRGSAHGVPAGVKIFLAAATARRRRRSSVPIGGQR